MHTALIDRQIKALMPVVRREALKMARTVPASVTLDALKAAGLEGAWQAARDFDGSGSLEGFASQRIRQRMIDWLRIEHPAGRSGNKIAATACGEDELELIASDDDDPTARLEQSEQFEAAMKAMRPRNRDVVERVLAGQPSKAIAESLGVSAGRVSQLVNEAVSSKRKESMPEGFDPGAVQIRTGVPVPKMAPVTRQNKSAALIARMPSGSSVILATLAAETLVREMRKQKIRYTLRKRSDTTAEVWREPSAEQLKGIPHGNR